MGILFLIHLNWIDLRVHDCERELLKKECSGANYLLKIKKK